MKEKMRKELHALLDDLKREIFNADDDYELGAYWYQEVNIILDKYVSDKA
jgi:hypothetical protein